jgi:uncharacterized membrane protein
MKAPAYLHSRFNEALLLGLMSLICFSLSIIRYNVTDGRAFLFLNWNLFLAFVPWLLSSLLVLTQHYRYHKLLLLVLLGVWLLFFPNAPYILTDLFHFKNRAGMPIWFDLILILSFAWTGILFGFFSLMDIENLLQPYFSKRSIILITVALIFATSFGVYVGRYLRWNSWDVLRAPTGIIRDIGSRFIHPADHPKTWGVTLLMGLFLNMMYWSFKLIRHSRLGSSTHF